MMKSSLFLIVPFLVAGTGCAGHGGSGMDSGKGMHKRGMGHHGMMKKMDANADGGITKDEFMQAHEMMFDRMKNQDGVIDMKQMPKQGPHKMDGPSQTGKPAN